jgi:hypothetical protein
MEGRLALRCGSSSFRLWAVRLGDRPSGRCRDGADGVEDGLHLCDPGPGGRAAGAGVGGCLG